MFTFLLGARASCPRRRDTGGTLSTPGACVAPGANRRPAGYVGEQEAICLRSVIVLVMSLRTDNHIYTPEMNYLSFLKVLTVIFQRSVFYLKIKRDLDARMFIVCV